VATTGAFSIDENGSGGYWELAQFKRFTDRMQLAWPSGCEHRLAPLERSARRRFQFSEQIMHCRTFGTELISPGAVIVGTDPAPKHFFNGTREAEIKKNRPKSFQTEVCPRLKNFAVWRFILP